jgi:hypothetical protein
VNIFKLIGLAFIQMAKQVWALPKTLSDVARQRQHRTILYKLEVERLDRIRNPEKYRGK